MNKTLDSILENIEDGTEDNICDEINLYIEITFFFDNLPHIKSYYIMTEEEYKKILLMHIDIYIEDFINNETLTKDKLDIHIINNSYNIKIIHDFINLYGNPFDILHLINIKKTKNIDKNNINDSDKNITDNDSDELVSSITNIINLFNKTNTTNNEQILELSIQHPEILNDDIIKDIM